MTNKWGGGGGGGQKTGVQSPKFCVFTYFEAFLFKTAYTTPPPPPKKKKKSIKSWGPPVAPHPTWLRHWIQHQNSAARLITAGCRKFSHITPVLDQLHWLYLCRFASTLKLCYLHFSAYMIWPLGVWDPHTDIFYDARSSQQNIMVSTHFYLQQPHCGTPYQSRSKKLILWSHLKTLLKTHLFNQYFVT